MIQRRRFYLNFRAVIIEEIRSCDRHAMICLVDVHYVIFHRIDLNCGGFVVFAIEFKFSPTAELLPLIPPEWIRDVNQNSAAVIHATSFEFLVGVIAETEMKIKPKDCEEEKLREGRFHFLKGS